MDSYVAASHNLHTWGARNVSAVFVLASSNGISSNGISINDSSNPTRFLVWVL